MSNSSYQGPRVTALVLKHFPGISSILVACLLNTHGRFLLLVEVEGSISGTDNNPVVAINLTGQQYSQLLAAGVNTCEISETIPQSRIGFDVQLKCVLVVGRDAFIVFDTAPVVPQPLHNLVLVRSQTCPIFG